MILSAEMILAINAELTDYDYRGRTHGTRSCVNAGCKGPLCSKYNRDRSRELYARRFPAEAARGPRNPELDELLDEIIEAHKDSKLSAAS